MIQPFSSDTSACPWHSSMLYWDCVSSRVSYSDSSAQRSAEPSQRSVGLCVNVSLRCVAINGPLRPELRSVTPLLISNDRRTRVAACIVRRHDRRAISCRRYQFGR